MIINIKNWGAVGQISIDTDKPLIVMCGQNSTGKTYVSYLLYALYSRMLRQEYMFDNIDLSVFEEIWTGIVSDLTFELKESHINAILKGVSSFFKEKLIPSIFAISEESAKELFGNFDLDIRLDEGTFENIVTNRIETSWHTSVSRVWVDKEKDSTKVTVKFKNHGREEVSGLTSISDVRHLDKIIFSFLLDLAYADKGYSRMLTVERNSVYTFSKELALNRSFGRLDWVVVKTEKEPSSPERYPMAVTDSLKIAVDLQQIQKNKGYFYDYAYRLEQNLLNGDIEINEDGAVEFVPASRSDERNHLPIQMTSSIVKTMASLIIYLKHIANKNDILIIDEPEMNLHPDNQRILIRIFAELINKGLNIVVSTHSDYIIRELNNLIMANEISEQKIMLEEGESVPYTRQQMLKRKDTEVLYFSVNGKTDKVRGTELPVTEFGFDVESIDATILSQNKTTHNLADILKYGESEK
ncbi:MAG: ATP-binding protein [Muribaculaceae bacterium]|nr:ATP-binding protein [Muribaculaceae bacterium]